VAHRPVLIPSLQELWPKQSAITSRFCTERPVFKPVILGAMALHKTIISIHTAKYSPTGMLPAKDANKIEWQGATQTKHRARRREKNRAAEEVY